MSHKTIVCRCEDVTLDDVTEAVAAGHRDIEEIKRYTGLGTGPCQGRECLVPTCRILAEAHARERPLQHPGAPRQEHPFTARPPLYPAPLGLFARARAKAGKEGA